MDLIHNLKLYRLNEKEYYKICKILGRSPRGIEWAIFSALWSEHCSYKSSAQYLKKFKSTSAHIIESMGENAGVIDIGLGERIAFKMESHNHPSFISPYEGASTGVGGILRDIFTMGAYPVALANYLCFGDLKACRMKTLVESVVEGIGGYGNCVGVPMLTGQTEFDSCYNQNILVNAMAVGLFRKNDVISRSQAQGIGNLVVYVGAKTGRDGIHGASMASASFENQEAGLKQKTTVQIGDPFLGKLLIESCYEVIQKGLVVAIQDMGAAGLTSSSFEMSAKGHVGLNLYLDKVPIRDSSLKPEDILLSESQERMLLICKKEFLKEIETVFQKWNLDAVVIGEVKEKKTVDIFWKNKKLTSLNPHVIVENSPHENRPYDEWRARNRVDCFSNQESLDFKKELLNLLVLQESCSRLWIYEQYDKRVGGRTAQACSETIGSFYLGKHRFLGIALGCRPYLMSSDAYEGAKDAFLFPALSLCTKGFQPLAATDCLNFGNPEKKEVMTEFIASVEALSETSKALDIPVVSGNVSFYNETEGQNIIPTPATGLVGLKINSNSVKGSFFVSSQSYIFLTRVFLGLSSTGLWEYVRTKRMQLKGSTIELRKDVLEILKKTACRKEVLSSRLVGRGGLAYHLVLMSFQNEIGFQVRGDKLSLKPEEWFYENYYDVLWESSSCDFQVEGFETYKIGITRKDKKVFFDNFEFFDLVNLKQFYRRRFFKL